MTNEAHNMKSPKSGMSDFSFLKSKKIVYLINVDWFFMSHRLPLARAARDAGAEVIVAAGDTGKGANLEKEGIRFVPLPFSRQGTSIFHELSTVYAIYDFLKRTKPDLLHTVSIKPVLYGSLLSRLFKACPVVNAISGLGYVFSKEKKASFLRGIVTSFYKAALGNPRSITIFQNPSDMATLLNAALLKKENTALIRGSGVDCSKFMPSFFPERPVIMLPARMLWDKGVGEFVQAADVLHPKFPQARFVLVGPADDENPKAITRETINEWMTQRTYLEWWGAKEPSNMPQIINSASIVILPSYHEGLPKVLLEAGACGRPIIATNIPGCREVVREGINGRLVPPKDSEALAGAIKNLLNNPDLLKEYGENSRKIACEEFAERIVIFQTFELYKDLLATAHRMGTTNIITS